MFVTHADGSRRVRFSPAFVCLSVCLSVGFPHDISKTDAATIITLDTEMFHYESRKPVSFGDKGKKMPAWVFALL